MTDAGYIYVGDLAERHQRAIQRFIAKYRQGAVEHGDIAVNKKWTTDMLGEAVDFAFYAIFELMELEGE